MHEVTRSVPSRVMAEEAQKTVAEQLDELGAQLDWVREYL
jgi:valyl-tRNA synthetase